ncbi:tyrosine-type recombinase/integrase [Agrobacterium sp. Ap1]|uniref:tyrosine-type recombinase/integrase n=1 Tax=Agrobacterium sp. Ap1 TaxID=2815337 RepID=UPI002570845C|nr:tyrosine-type recombinase/integrase [Agrobacterium sp. Ap1]
MFSTYLKSPFPSDAFDEEYQAALRSEKSAHGEIGKARTKPGSMAALVVSYYGSPEFKGTASSTQSTYRGICEKIRNDHGERIVRELRRQHIVAILGKMSATPAAANNYLRMLRILVRHAVNIEWITRDPTLKVKGYSNKTDGFHTWTESEIGQFERYFPIGTRPRLAMALMLYTGQRRGDAVALGWQHVTGQRISVVQSKTKTRLAIKMHASLIEALAMAPKGSDTFLLTSFGKPYSPAGFGNWFREQCDAAGLPQCSSHGLRKAAARRLAEAGNGANHIAAVTGHLTLKEVERYTRAADQEKMADAAVDTMPERSDRQTKNSQQNEIVGKIDA